MSRLLQWHVVGDSFAHRRRKRHAILEGSMFLYQCAQAFVNARATLLLVLTLITSNTLAQGAPGVELNWWLAKGVLNAEGEGASAEAAADAAIAYKGYGYADGVHRTGACAFFREGGTGNNRWSTYLCPLADKDDHSITGIFASSRVVLFPGAPCTSINPTENCQYRPTDEQVVGDKNLGHPTDYCPVGNPINQLTGNKFELSVDYQAERWSGSLGGLSLQRTYNSQDSRSGNRFGHGWRSNVEQRIVTSADSFTRIGMQRADGRVLRFIGRLGLGSEESYLPEKDVNDNLISLGQGRGWKYLVAADQSTEIYSPLGFLLSITSREGLTRHYNYSDADTPASIAPREGLLLSITEAGGSLSFTYNSQARITQATIGTGQTIRYGYDSDGRLHTVTWPDGNTRTYLYNEPAHTEGANLPTALTGILDENGMRYATYQYDSSGRAVSSEHAGGAGKVSVAYGDNQSTVSDALGSTRTYYAGMSNGSHKVTGLDRAGPGCPAAANSTEYDDDGNVTRRTDFNGVVTTYGYVGYGYLPGFGYRRLNLEKRRVEADGQPDKRIISTQWNHQWSKPTIVAQSKRITRYSYDAVGNLTEVSVQATADLTGASEFYPRLLGSPRRWKWTYNDKHRVLTHTDPKGNITRYSYYTDTANGHIAGDVHQIINALGHVTTYEAYDADGRVTRLRDANGVIADFTYHPRGWMLSRTVRAHADGSSSPNDAITQVAYDAVGQIIKVIDADGVAIGYTYDDAHRLTDITDALGNRIHVTLDAAGNVIKEDSLDTAGALHRTLSRTYTALGQLASIKDGIGRLIFDASDIDSYDGNGNLLRSSDGQGVQRRYDYDPLNRLIGTLDNYSGLDAATKDTAATFAYDGRDRLEGVSDPEGLQTIYQVDGQDNLTALDSPDTGRSAATHDAAGNLIEHTDGANEVTTRRYDALHRVIHKSYAHIIDDGVSYYYDEADDVTGCHRSYPIGRLTRAKAGVVTTTYCYDALGHVTQKRQYLFGDDITQYRYTAAGRLAGIVYPSGTQVSYTRNAAGQVTAMQTTSPRGETRSVVSGITYLPFGPIASYTLGNGQTVTRHYDANYRLSDLTSTALTLHYARDAMGNPTMVSSTGGAQPATETYTYDPLYRLVAVKDTSGAAIEAYTYNKTGDRLSKSGRGLATGDYGYQTGTHWLTRFGNATRHYSANGLTASSTAGGQTHLYEYIGHQLDWVTLDNGTWWGTTVSSYTYDAFGQRAEKRTYVPRYSDRRFAYNEVGQLIGDYDPHYDDGRPVPTYGRDYLWLDTLPIGVVDVSRSGSSVNYVIADGLDTPRVITGPSGQTIWHWPVTGNPFGEQQPVSNAGYVYNLRFPGQYYDMETGFHYNMFRDYDRTTGRYVQSDPIGLAGGLSTYGYVENNPLSFADPLGLTKWQMGMFMTSGGRYGVEIGYAHFTATSDCAGGKRGHADGHAAFIGPSVGTPAGFSGSFYTVDDGIPGNSGPSTLNGLFVYQGAGAAFGAGYSVSGLRLGSAVSSGLSGSAEAGLGAGIAVNFGRSMVTQSSQTTCGCP
jgi:RHS repeat-associated protein